MLMILIDTLVLMVLLKTVNDENIEFVSAIIVAVITAIATAALAIALSLVIGIWGVVLAERFQRDGTHRGARGLGRSHRRGWGGDRPECASRA